MGEDPENDVDRLAGEILRYLHGHPGASDSAEGIAKWWIKRQRLEDTLFQVQRALDRLVEQSLLEPHRTGAGGTRYLLRGGAGEGSRAGDGEPNGGTG